jgi:prepilin-type N-terminal cleavage/methylation domain-containing protein
MTRLPNQSGMTLVEMLIALLLVGLIASLSATLLPAMKRAASRSGDFQRRAAELGRSHDFLRGLVENSLTAADLGPAGAAIAPSAFEAERLEIVTRLPEGLGKGGLQRVSLAVEGPQGHRALKLHVASLRGEAAEAEGNMIEDASEITWSYFDRGTGLWSEHGPNDGRLPDLVRLSVETRPTGRWPPMIAAPQMEGGVLCAFDMLARTCRRAQP